MRVSGGCWLNENDDAYFDIYAETATVPFSIPTTDEPTAQQGYPCAKASSAAAPTILEILRPILLTLLLIFLGTLIYLMNRRLREQERFQESIREQLSNLSHIARLNTLSEMVGVLAHKLNQPLASVSNYAATAEVLSKKEPTGSEKLAGVLTSIGREAFRAGAIIRRLRHLVRKKTPGSLPVHISEIIPETVELFKTQHVTASGLVQTETAADRPDRLRADPAGRSQPAPQRVRSSGSPIRTHAIDPNGNSHREWNGLRVGFGQRNRNRQLDTRRHLRVLLHHS